MSRAGWARRAGTPGRRSWWVPEVLQTSAADCGPAALAAVLAGFGCRESVEALREACGTGREGTSIDGLEEVARCRGLDAAQVMVPVDHLTLWEAGCLPCIAVTRLPDGVLHFVVLWRVWQGRVQVMDPAAGRRWPTTAAVKREVHRHRATVEAAAWEEWATSAEWRRTLERRLADLGFDAGARRAWLRDAGDVGREAGGCGRSEGWRRSRRSQGWHQSQRSQGWQRWAALDAAVRWVRRGIEGGQVRRGAEAERLVARLMRAEAGGGGDDDRVEGGDGGDGCKGGRGPGGVPREAWTVGLAPAAADSAGGGQEDRKRLWVEGAVVVRVAGWRAGWQSAMGSVGGANGGPALDSGADARGARSWRPAAAGRERGANPWWRPARGRGWWWAVAEAWVRPWLSRWPSDAVGCGHGASVATAGVAAVGGAAARLVEVGLWAAVLGLCPWLGARRLAAGTVGALAVWSAAAALLEWSAATASAAAGRRRESELRASLDRRLPRLPDGYFRTRLVSDLAERAHLLGRLRRGPEAGVAALRAAAEMVLAAAGVAWIDPRLRWGAAAAAMLTLATPAILAPRLAERARRVRSHLAAVSGWELEVLCGREAIAAHGAAVAFRRRHEELLGGWLRARRGAAAMAVGVETAVGLEAAGVSVALVTAHLRRAGADGALLPLLLWLTTMAAAGQRLARLAAVELAVDRALYGRIEEVLRARLEGTERQGSRTAVRDDGVLGVLGQGRDAPARPLPGGERRPVGGASAGGGAAVRLVGAGLRLEGRWVLRGVDLDLASGRHVALVGPSGSGKSSLLGLLLGWSAASEGHVMVDGQVIGEGLPPELRRAMVWVAPEVALWERPLLGNLARDAGNEGDGAARGAGLAEALREAQLIEVLTGLPDGLQTRLGAGGRRLSGGEGQRVRLARALMRPGVRLALLDEPLRGLGAEQRATLLSAARRRWRRATLVCVTHSPGEAMGFDEVVVMEGGLVVEHGSPAGLAEEKRSKFRRLLDEERAVVMALRSPGWRRVGLRRGRLAEEARGVAAAVAMPAGAARAVEAGAMAEVSNDGAAAARWAGSWPDAGRKQEGRR